MAKIKKTGIFLISCIVSLCLHVPIYASIAQYYFNVNLADYIKKDEWKGQATFIYVPKEREVVITKVESVPQNKDIQELVEITTSTGERDEGNEVISPPVQRDRSKEKSPQQVTRIPQKLLRPTVENVDLDNKEVRDAFFSYYDLLSSIIGRYAVYPEYAQREYLSGAVFVSFILRKNGHLGEVVLRQSSGYSILDRAAISAIQSAAPFPPLPLEIKEKEIRLNVPISFEIE